MTNISTLPLSSSSIPSLEAKDIFECLKGSWRLTREITQLDKMIITMEGEASFCPLPNHPNRLEYHETVTLYDHKQQTSSEAFQTYFYEFNEEHNSLTKFFRDGRMFYQLMQTKDNFITGSHLCKQDLYHALYEFHPHSHQTLTNFTCTYNVTGPYKNHRIVSQYVRHKLNVGYLEIYFSHDELKF